MSSEIRAKTPSSIKNNKKAENTQTRILKTVRRVRERYRSGMIHSIKKNQPSIILSINSSKGKNKHPISEEPFFLMLSLYHKRSCFSTLILLLVSAKSYPLITSYLLLPKKSHTCMWISCGEDVYLLSAI